MAKTIDPDNLPSDLTVEKCSSTYTRKVTAAAIALGVSEADLLAFMQHDGSEIIDNTATDDDCKYRGFTVQEIVDACLANGLQVIEVDLALGDNAPANYDRAVSETHRRQVVDLDRFEQALLNNRGLALYFNVHEPTSQEHVFAFIGNGSQATLVDPVAELKFLYEGQKSLLEQDIQLVSLLCISKGK